MVNEMIEIKTCHDYNLIFDYLKKYELPHEIEKSYEKWLGRLKDLKDLELIIEFKMTKKHHM